MLGKNETLKYKIYIIIKIVFKNMWIKHKIFFFINNLTLLVMYHDLNPKIIFLNGLAKSGKNL